jgi:hypothetical protein
MAKRKNPTAFEIGGLRSLATNMDCSMSMLIDAIMANCVIEEIGRQVAWLKEKEAEEQSYCATHSCVDCNSRCGGVNG